MIDTITSSTVSTPTLRIAVVGIIMYDHIPFIARYIHVSARVSYPALQIPDISYCKR